MATDNLRRQPSLFGFPVKDLAFIALVFQNAALILLTQYSRAMPLVNGDRYCASTAIFLTEIVKISFFLSMAIYDIATSPQTPDTSTVSELSNALSRAVFTGDSWLLAVPALLFTLQNGLQYLAASNLDAATFSITSQLKIVSAAMFSILLMGKALSVRKWLSLVLLAVGVAIVQLSHLTSQGRPLSINDLRDGVSFNAPRNVWEIEADSNAAAGQLSKRSATYAGIDEDLAAANPKMNASVGLAAAVVACFLSGVACVYLETILRAKNEAKVSVWVRNVQLSFYCMLQALFVGVIFKDGEHLSKTGFFTGYNSIVWMVILLQAMGGILVALNLHYSDSVIKSLATSVSAVITFVASVLFLEFQTTALCLVGAVTSIGGAFMYSTTSDGSKHRPPPINVTQYEKTGESGYFDLEAVATPGRSPLHDPLRGALSTSRPGTPVSERRPLRSKSSELRSSKREQ